MIFSVANRLPNNWSYSAPTRVYVLVASKSGCTNATGFLDFKIGTKITVNNIETAVCDNERDGKTNIKISDYLPSDHFCKHNIFITILFRKLKKQ